ncbi:LIM/homeobox protein Lhx2-like [Tachypleus tridentatus]|uniref:LIM/homeobox protein Lhx2-like n=1 Tax=Tachypleus tridentatus TaxID=6853 RepID=UPI003FD45985
MVLKGILAFDLDCHLKPDNCVEMPTLCGLDETTSGMAAVCAGCNGRIMDRYYLMAVDRQWHVNCLKCCECKFPLDSELTCFSRGGNIYCKKDYYRLFSVKLCARCHLAISSTELVMRARDFVYHLHCFTCTTCNTPFTKGEYFGLKDDAIYCRYHYELLIQYTYPYNSSKSAVTSTTTYSEYDRPRYEDTAINNNLCPPDVRELSGLSAISHTESSDSSSVTYPPTKGRPKKRKGTGLITNIETEKRTDTKDQPTIVPLKKHVGLSPPKKRHSKNSSIQPGLEIRQEKRPKRLRTSFKHHQVRTMKSYFLINHNPDAKDLRQLSQKTGLSKRVLQVWFQNARAKWRRNLLRQQTQGPEVVQESKPLVEMTSQETLLSVLRPLAEQHLTPITQEEQNVYTYTSVF